MLILKLFLLINLLRWFLWYTPFHCNSYHLNILNLSFKTSMKGAHSGFNYRVDRLRLKPEKGWSGITVYDQISWCLLLSVKFIYVTWNTLHLVPIPDFISCQEFLWHQIWNWKLGMRETLLKSGCRRDKPLSRTCAGLQKKSIEKFMGLKTGHGSCRPSIWGLAEQRETQQAPGAWKRQVSM